MKNSLLIILLLLVNNITAQVHVGGTSAMMYKFDESIDSDANASLKKTTTVFAIPDNLFPLKKDYESQLQDAWRITPFLVYKATELDTFLTKPNFSYFSFGRFSTPPGLMSNEYLFYDLWMKQYNRKGIFNGAQYFARLQVNQEEVVPGYNKASEPKTGNAFFIDAVKRDSVWSSRALLSLHPFYLIPILRLINDKLAVQVSHGVNSGYKNEPELQNLKNDTLFIPDIFYNNCRDEGITEASDYGFKIHFAKFDILYKRFLNDPKGFFYLGFFGYANSTIKEKYVEIMHSRKGALYIEHSTMSDYLKTKDLKRVSRAFK